MNTEAERAAQERATLKAEEQAKAATSAQLRADLAVAATILIAAQLRSSGPLGLRKLVIDLIGGIVPRAKSMLEVHSIGARHLGQDQAGAGSRIDPWSMPQSERTEELINTSDPRTKARLAEAVELAVALPMNHATDTLAVLAKARSAIQSQEADAAWVVVRGAALGHHDVAKGQDLNLVWVAERNACLHCLAYQGHVIAPGGSFPRGLTYGDTPLKPWGLLVGPPLHPHCRCQLELTELQPGQLDTALAREAARSVARGFTDFASEPATYRAADRLVRGVTGLSTVKLPRSVLERTARNLAAGRFKARPGSVQARAEIAQRSRDRARRSITKTLN